MQIGLVNNLKVERETEHGFYLVDENYHEVLLPGVYISDEMKCGDYIDVFIYKDSMDRLVATTLKPYIKLGEFAMLKVKEICRFGAFVDWGLPKDLLVPFAEQNVALKAGVEYPFYLLHDRKTDRLIASAKLNKYLEFENVELEVGQAVSVLLSSRNENGIVAIVENCYYGLIFDSDIHCKVKIGDSTTCYVKNIREDGKLDLVFSPIGYKDSIDEFSDQLLRVLKKNNGVLRLTDKSSPESIKAVLGMSKKAFKKAIGKLYKEKIILLKDDSIVLK